MKRVPEQLEHRTTLYGTINGEKFKLVGGGTGRPYDGVIESSLRTNPGPVGFPIGLVSMHMVTGFPTFSKYEKDTHDLFKKSDGYEYDRVLRFENGGKLEGVHKVSYAKDGALVGDFHVEGEVDAPALGQIEPVVEHFEPAGNGVVRSHHKVVWRTADGGRFAAEGESEYRLNHDEPLPFKQYRHIVFETTHTPESITQKERLTVVRNLHDLPAH